MEESLEDIYSGFLARCVAIRDGRFIMSNNMIAQLLKYLASHEETMEFLSECNKLYDYKKEYHDAISGVGAFDFFILPDNHRKIVALVTGLLYEIDRGTIEFLCFIKKYFNRGDVDLCFEAFYNEVITPYSRAYQDMMFNEPIELDDMSEDDQEELSSSISEQLVPYMVALSETIVGDTSLATAKRAELLDMLEGMCYAIEKGNVKLLKYMWIGLKNTFSQYRIAGSMLGGIKSVLVTYGIINN